MNQITIRWSLSHGVVGYAAALPDGRFAALTTDAYLSCEWGHLPQPPGGALMYLDLAPDGRVIGQTHDTNSVVEFDGMAWVPLSAAVCPNAAVYRPDSMPAIVRTVEEYQQTGGWRYCREDDVLVSVVSSYADPARGLYGWTEWPDVAIGQGDDEKVGGGVVVRFVDDGILRRLAFNDLRPSGVLRDIKAKRHGDLFAIAAVDYQQALTTLTWATLAELRALPPVETVPVPPDPPDPPTPIPPPVVRLTSATPTTGSAPLTVRAVAAIESGHADRLEWWVRSAGDTLWLMDADNPADDPDHHFRFDASGDYEIRVHAVGPGGTSDADGPAITVTPADKPEPPIPPQPESNFPVLKEIVMEPQIGLIKSLRGAYGRYDDRDTGPWASLQQGWRGVVWDGGPEAKDDPRYHFRRTDVGDGRSTLESVPVGGWFGADATSHSGDIGAQFYVTPRDRAPGDYEMPAIYEGTLKGYLLGVVEYANDQGKYPSCAFAFEALS